MSSPDRFPVRVVVLALGLVLVGSVAAITFLAFTQTPIPDALTQLSIGALTGTTALLARTQPATATEVQVMNTPADPVPTTSDVDELFGDAGVTVLEVAAISFGVVLVILLITIA